jgi:hypothetical protein
MKLNQLVTDLEYIDTKLESMIEHMMVVQAHLMQNGLLPNYNSETGTLNADAMQVGTAEYHWRAVKKKHNDATTAIMKLLDKCQDA